MTIAKSPAFFLVSPFPLSALYKSTAKIPYSSKWAVFLTIKSCQKISEVFTVGKEENEKIRIAQIMGGTQNLMIFIVIF